MSLSELAEADHQEVVGNLLHVIYETRNPLQSMLRKAAAYRLGQVGEPRAMKQLRAAYDDGSADGVHDAMRVAMTAIKLAPLPQHSQSERCQIIGGVYNNRLPADWE